MEEHQLTVDAGNFDLNRSLFERLVLGGAAHCTLELQHRMRPEISQIARLMTYPELRDGNVLGRPHVRGLAKDVVWIDHRVFEEGSTQGGAFAVAAASDDPLASMSKRNAFEVSLTVAVVCYLLKQGYTPDKLVVLTPYLGQLRALQVALAAAAVGASLGERDEAEINELLESRNVQQPELDAPSEGVRISTIDNYQARLLSAIS